MSDALDYIAETLADAAEQASRKAIQAALSSLLDEDTVRAELGISSKGNPWFELYVPAVYESIYFDNVKIRNIDAFPLDRKFQSQVEEAQDHINAYRAFAAKINAIADAHQAKLDAFVSA